jgi:hypothetical protein
MDLAYSLTIPGKRFENRNFRMESTAIVPAIDRFIRKTALLVIQELSPMNRSTLLTFRTIALATVTVLPAFLPAFLPTVLPSFSAAFAQTIPVPAPAPTIETQPDVQPLPPTSPALPNRSSDTPGFAQPEAQPEIQPAPRPLTQEPTISCPAGQFASKFPDVTPNDWAYEAVNRVAGGQLRCFPIQS